MLRIETSLLGAGIVVASVLLGRFAVDFASEFPLLGLPFAALVVVTLGTAALNLRAGLAGGADRARAPRALLWPLLAAVPLGYVASSLDCMGLSLWGCTPFCTVVKLALVPAMAAGCVAYAWTRRRSILLGLTAVAFVPLAPHCICYNPANGWWIDRLGASPMCYAWGFAVAVVVLTALHAGAGLRRSLAVCTVVVGGATAFFVGHHYLHFPW